MSTTADATLTITCPDWCDYDAQTHANDLHEWEGHCIHNGVVAVVEDTSGRGVEWSPWKPERVLVSSPIDVGLTITTNPDGRPVATPGIRLAGDVHPIGQIEALVVELQRAIALAQEQHPDWRLEQ